MSKKGAQKTVDLATLNTVRFGHTYLMDVKRGAYQVDDLNHLNGYLNYITNQDRQNAPTYKVGVMLVCINQPYWQYAIPVIQGIRQFFLPGHDTEIMLWSDIQNFPEAKHVDYGCTVFPTESVGWPYPTLMRYHMFLEQKDYLEKFDYLFYIDLDMRIVNIVGDEILGNGLTGAEHPMYSLDRKFIPPYEPNPASASYIPRPGKVVTEDGKPRFKPLYFAGGFQGGKTEDFVTAMEKLKEMIDSDLEQNYIPIWNDESAWNKYLFDNPPDVVLDPSYVYPDSMIDGYYKKVWGRDYTPRIVTLTKPFTTSAEGGQAAAQLMNQLT